MFLESLNSIPDVEKQNKSIKVDKYKLAGSGICQYLLSESNLSDQTWTCDLSRGSDPCVLLSKLKQSTQSSLTKKRDKTLLITILSLFLTWKQSRKHAHQISSRRRDQFDSFLEFYSYKLSKNNQMLSLNKERDVKSVLRQTRSSLVQKTWCTQKQKISSFFFTKTISNTQNCMCESFLGTLEFLRIFRGN